MTKANFLNKIKNNTETVNLEIIEKAFDFATQKHSGQKRLSGEQYVTHPIEVSLLVSEMGMDSETIAAALLHDTLEDTETTFEEIVENFGKNVAELVDGVTTLGAIDFSKLPSDEVQEAKFKHMIESLRKFFLAMAADIRVVIIKLADRLHNMRTLSALKPADQKRISRETLEVFAPLADRMGMGSIKAELEDLSFYYTNPVEYKRIKEILRSGEKERAHYLAKFKKSVASELKKEGITTEIDGRVKHIYSIYKKLQKVDGDISKIYDILAVRIILDSVENCYRVLGIIHKLYKPMIYRIKDYISVPKPNGYQSLHTTVLGIGGTITEVQIRTRRMHDEAENGVAAHWHYAETKAKKAYAGQASFAKGEQMRWMKGLADWQNNLAESENLEEVLSLDFLNTRIFIFTPQGDIIDLPEGATPVDFAYEIHTQIGHKCRGAKVNGKITTLDQRLANRDIVEIILAPKNDKSGPSRHWLDFVKTAKAKQNIRSWFKKENHEENVLEGEKLLSAELALFNLEIDGLSDDQKGEVLGISGRKEWEDVLGAIGDGSVSARQVSKRLIGARLYQALDEKKKITKEPGAAILPGENFSNLDGILIRYADCCKPKTGDKVKGFITQGKGITIHRADCKSLLTSPSEKIIDINFGGKDLIVVEVEIHSSNRLGMIRDVSKAISDEGINIDRIENMRQDDGSSIIRTVLSAPNPSQIADLLPVISEIDGVLLVRQK